MKPGRRKTADDKETSGEAKTGNWPQGERMGMVGETKGNAKGERRLQNSAEK